MQSSTFGGNWPSLNYNAGISLAYWAEGIPVAIFCFVIVFLIEALFFHEFLTWKKSFWYSFVINLVSTIIGFLILPIVGYIHFAVFAFLVIVNALVFPILFYALTVFIEYGAILILFKANWKKKVLLKALFRYNFFSYIGLFVALFILSRVL